jgi:DNA-binding NtrC family response regulator
VAGRGGRACASAEVVPDSLELLAWTPRVLGFASAVSVGGAGVARTVPLDGGGMVRWGQLEIEHGGAAGTRLNGEPMCRGARFKPGDVLRSGDQICVFAPGPLTRPSPDDDMIGSSVLMAGVRRSVRAVARRSQSVVVTGQTGTGKELVAQRIHRESGRIGPFVAVNCSTFTADLLASELFGHARGAFTGAVSEHNGLFRAAHGGTLLLDELADVSPAVQASLLRVLETRSVRPLGTTKELRVDVRVVAATNVDLELLVQRGLFRADLYARLAQWTIRTPSLAERREDIPALTTHLLTGMDCGGRVVEPDLWEALLVHPWPLNVRGLANVLSVAVISAGDDAAPLGLSPEVVDALRRTRCMLLPTQLEAPVPAHALLLGRDAMVALLERHHGHVAAAAREAGCSRAKWYRGMTSEGLDPSDYRGGKP